MVLHVETQNGWDKLGPDRGGNRNQFQFGQFRFNRPPLMEPLTRPYGLLPGMVFQALVPTEFQIGTYDRVEIERYNPQRPKEIPRDELVTFQVRPDPKGVFTSTLTEPGWWCMTAQREAEQKKDSDGKNRSVWQRTTMWVHVEAKAGK
jgi:cobalt/nickel transport protein